MENPYKIYIITNKINKKVYIGQTCSTISHRFSQHKYPKNKKNLHLHNAMNKYGRKNFIIELLMDNLDLEEASYWEDYYMVIFDSRNRERGYNIKDAGSTGKHSPETIEKIKKIQGSPEMRQRKREMFSGEKSAWFGKKGKDHPVFGRKKPAAELKIMAEKRSGDKSNLAKFTREDVIALRTEAAIGKLTKKELAIKYNMSNENVRRILKNEIWKTL